MIVGNLAEEYREYNFGFYNGEPYLFFGEQTGGNLADLMNQAETLLYPAFADSCPNTLIEALNCGLCVEGVNPYGGQAEVYAQFPKTPHVFTLTYMLEQYQKQFLPYV
jgi:hypothetical protein